MFKIKKIIFHIYSYLKNNSNVTQKLAIKREYLTMVMEIMIKM